MAGNWAFGELARPAQPEWTAGGEQWCPFRLRVRAFPAHIPTNGGELASSFSFGGHQCTANPDGVAGFKVLRKPIDTDLFFREVFEILAPTRVEELEPD